MKFTDKGSHLSWSFITLPILLANTDQTPSTVLCAAVSTLRKGVESPSRGAHNNMVGKGGRGK